MNSASKRGHTCVRVLVVDDHPMMRLGLAQFLSAQVDIKVVGEAHDASSALAAAEKLRPDVILLDISLQGRSGLDVAKELRSRFPGSKILVHSMHDDRLFSERALRAGAMGYVTKHQPGSKLLQALRQVARGERYLSSNQRLGSNLKSATPATGVSPTEINLLTDREFEVFRLIGQGCANREVAKQLGISVKTVEAHREHLRHKLGTSSATALNLLAVRWAASENTI